MPKTEFRTSLFLILILKLAYIGTEEEKIKYELTMMSPDHEPETTTHRGNVSITHDTFSVKVGSNVRELRPGMLQINARTLYFICDNKSLERIEPGVFNDQNISEKIQLQNNQLTEVRTGTFKSCPVGTIDLTDNKIASMDQKAFDDLPNLMVVLLNNNRIVTLQKKLFVGTPKLMTLDLAYNELTELGPDWFDSVTKVESFSLELHHNEIERIDPRAFDGVNIWDLALGNNKIEKIPDEVFSENGIKLLNLQNNRIKKLPGAFFELNHLFEVNVANNPLGCGTRERLEAWAKSTNTKVYHTMYDDNCR